MRIPGQGLHPLKGIEQDGNLSAAARIRRLLEWAGVPTAVPPSQDDLAAQARSLQGRRDGPQAVAWVRNRIVHPRPSPEEDPRCRTSSSRPTGWRSGTWSWCCSDFRPPGPLRQLAGSPGEWPPTERMHRTNAVGEPGGVTLRGGLPPAGLLRPAAPGEGGTGSRRRPAESACDSPACPPREPLEWTSVDSSTSSRVVRKTRQQGPRRHERPARGRSVATCSHYPFKPDGKSQS